MVQSRGLCANHYAYHRYHGTLETAALPRAKRGRKPMTVAVPVVIEVPAPVVVNEKRVEYEHLLGKVSDTVIAEVYGFQRGAVSALRRRRGIPALTGEEAHWTTVGFKNFLASHECTAQ